MKIFLSWSKEPAKTIAIELKDVIGMLLPNADVWMSERDIQKGHRWSSAIAKELDETDVGVVIVTEQNRREPWLFFEAGALSKSVDDGRVHPLLVGVGHAALEGPLSQFQATKFERADVLELVRQLNAAATKPKAEADLVKGFDRLWDKLHADVMAAMKAASPDEGDVVLVPQLPFPVESDVLHDEEHRVLEGMFHLRNVGEEYPTADDLARALRMNPERVKLRLGDLEKREFVWIGLSLGGPSTYSVTDKARRYAIDKGWI